MEGEGLVVDVAHIHLGVVIVGGIVVDVGEGTHLTRPSIEAFVMSD